LRVRQQPQPRRTNQQAEEQKQSYAGQGSSAADYMSRQAEQQQQPDHEKNLMWLPHFLRRLLG